LVIGGGIDGAGIFRDLSLQGVDVLLVEKGDFASGASAGSSRMIHGGLRYLEFGEFRLVRESLKDRNLLLKNAPHYVFPLATTIPLFCRFSGIISSAFRFFRINLGRPANRGSLIVRAGLMFYDWFTRKDRIMPKSFLLSRKKTLEKREHLPKSVIGSANYYDAWISYPERLVLELLLDAEALHKTSHALNYVTADSAGKDTVTLRDELTGEEITIKPQVVINATGAWIDFTNKSLNAHAKQLISGSKGGHLILENEELFQQLKDGMIYYETKDGRVAIAFTWLGMCLIGSTDIRCEDPDVVRCDEYEAEYILDSIRHIFPTLKIDRSDIVSRFTGVRPLAYSPPDAATVTVSRDHRFHKLPQDAFDFPYYSMIGGKWTTFRAFAEQGAQRVLHDLDVKRRVDTEKLPIGGGKDYPESEDAKKLWTKNVSEEFQIDNHLADLFLERYGTRAKQVAQYIAETPEETPDQPLEHHEGYTRREIEFLLEKERVVHLDDLVLRRTSVALLGELTTELLNELADILAKCGELSDEQKQEEIQRTLEILKDRHGIVTKSAES